MLGLLGGGERPLATGPAAPPQAAAVGLTAAGIPQLEGGWAFRFGVADCIYVQGMYLDLWATFNTELWATLG